MYGNVTLAGSLDYLTIIITDHITEYKEGADGPLQHILERLIAWVEKNVLGKAKTFEELQVLLYAQGTPSEQGPKGVSHLIESMIPYRYYEALSGDEIEDIKVTTNKIYKDAIDKAFSKAMDKPSLMPTQLYEEDKSTVPEFKQEDVVTPWMESSEYERI